jgi:hypothetical protein
MQFAKLITNWKALIMPDIEGFDGDIEDRPLDPRQEEAREYLRTFFEQNKEQVFFSKQLEVRNEHRYFHWITYRAIRELEDEGLLNGEWRKLPGAGAVRLLWHRSFRYYKREASRVVSVVDEYANPNISASIGFMVS